MADKIKNGDKPEDNTEAAAETKNPVAPPAAVQTVDDGGLLSPPPGAVVQNAVVDVALTETAPAHEFDGDEFLGQGGTFAIDPVTGNRAPVYEAYTTADGQTRYRRVP